MRLLAAALVLCGARAYAATIYDLGTDPIPLLPDVIDLTNSPVYITNNGAGAEPDPGGDPGADPGATPEPNPAAPAGRAAPGELDSLRVGQYAQLHIGYDNTSVATDDISIPVAGNADINGSLFMGKGATNGERGRPDAATTTAIGLAVNGAMRVGSTGQVVLHGASEDARTSLTADSLTVDGGLFTMEQYSSLATTGAGGVRIDSGGRLAAKSSGGEISTGTGRITVGRDGFLDAGQGNILVTESGGIDIAGGYRAGYDAATGETTRLTAETGGITFSTDSSIALSRDLQRYLNTGGLPALSGAVLAETGDNVVFSGTGTPPTLQTGMGAYRLGVTPGGADGYASLAVTGVEGGVAGNRLESDKTLFHGNMGKTWSSGAMNRSVSDNIYNLVAAESLVVQGTEGALNQAVLEDLVDGLGDQGIFEMYTGASQWGVNNAAINTATEFLSGIDRRVERLGAELDRLGEGWGSGSPGSDDAYGSIMDGMNSSGGERFWIGGFGRNEEALFDDGIAGYSYRPRGVIAGYDKIVGDFALGAAAAYGSGQYEDKAATQNDSTITSYSAGVFATYHNKTGLNATAHAAVSLLDNDLSDTRNGMQRKADYSGHAWSLGARVGYDKLLADRLMFSPSAGLTAAQSFGRAHDESLNGTGVLQIGEARRDSVLVPLDLSLSYDIIRQPSALLRLTGNFGYAYDMNDGGLGGTFTYGGLAGSDAMNFADREAGRHRFNLGAGLLYTGRKFDLGARYDFFKRSDQTTHQMRGNLGVKF